MIGLLRCDVQVQGLVDHRVMILFRDRIIMVFYDCGCVQRGWRYFVGMLCGWLGVVSKSNACIIRRQRVFEAPVPVGLGVLSFIMLIASWVTRVSGTGHVGGFMIEACRVLVVLGAVIGMLVTVMVVLLVVVVVVMMVAMVFVLLITVVVLAAEGIMGIGVTIDGDGEGANTTGYGIVVVLSTEGIIGVSVTIDGDGERADTTGYWDWLCHYHRGEWHCHYHRFMKGVSVVDDHAGTCTTPTTSTATPSTDVGGWPRYLGLRGRDNVVGLRTRRKRRRRKWGWDCPLALDPLKACLVA